jgi:hypothetical protein
MEINSCAKKILLTSRLARSIEPGYRHQPAARQEGWRECHIQNTLSPLIVNKEFIQ